ncbi:MAG: hypothetical protein ACYC6W_10940 [Nitrosotalea sp.]
MSENNLEIVIEEIFKDVLENEEINNIKNPKNMEEYGFNICNKYRVIFNSLSKVSVKFLEKKGFEPNDSNSAIPEFILMTLTGIGIMLEEQNNGENVYIEKYKEQIKSYKRYKEEYHDKTNMDKTLAR